MVSQLLPPVYDGRSPIDKWLQRFDACASANAWDATACDGKIQAFLEGEALVVYLELDSASRAFQNVRKALEDAFSPEEARGEYLREFEGRRLQAGEPVRTFMYELKRLLSRALPDIGAEARDSLLYHHFVNGLPDNVAFAIKASGDCTTPAAALKRAIVLMAMPRQSALATVASVEPTSTATASAVDALTSRLAELESELTRVRQEARCSLPEPCRNSAAVLANSTQRSERGQVLNFSGPKKNRRKLQCWSCSAWGHLARNCTDRGDAEYDRKPFRLRQGNGRASAAFRGGLGPTVEPPLCGLASLSQPRERSPLVTVVMGTVKTSALIDSGSCVSLLREDTARRCSSSSYHPTGTTLRTAANQPLRAIGQCDVNFRIDDRSFCHTFLVVRDLVVDVILGTDFLALQKAELQFRAPSEEGGACFSLKWPQSAAGSVGAIELGAIGELEASSFVPSFATSDEAVDLPACPPYYQGVIAQYRSLFRRRPGSTDLVYHHIPTGDSAPVRVPARRVPIHLRDNILAQLRTMLDQGIICPSSSPWLAPAVYTPKKNGDVRIAVDYRELNKRTVKDAYPLPLPDEIHDRLHGSSVFSTLDMNSGYWQVPVHPDDVQKTAFTPGPGLGAFEFKKMPFGLTGAPSTFQRLMDSVLRDLPFVYIYLDDAMVHSSCETEHITHLQTVFRRLQQAGLTLSGCKCHIAQAEVKYLGHIFDKTGMRPDPDKIRQVRDWPVPTSVSQLREFLGLASYYRRFVQGFAAVAAPLHELLATGTPFTWEHRQARCFDMLKSALVTAPVLAYPSPLEPFVVTTDASDTGLGAILEQGGRVLAYKSRALSSSEKNYSTIQKECLALIYALKEFRHYLLGRRFLARSDHNPLVWLNSQKSQGILARWAVALQEFDFDIEYQKAELNTHADALSRRPSDEQPACLVEVRPADEVSDLIAAQQSDPCLRTVVEAIQSGRRRAPPWHRQPLRRWRQMWGQLKLVDGVLYRYFRPRPGCDYRYALVVPPASQADYLRRYHDDSGHQGVERTYDLLRDSAYWVNMSQDVARYCRTCQICQTAKGARFANAPLVPIPVGRPWDMVAVDILKVTMSTHGREYLLVLQDSFTKWLEAVPLRDTSATTVREALLSIFCRFGMPCFLHSDQGSNFEAEIVGNLCQAFGIQKTRTTPYHPQGDGMVERANRTLLSMLRTSCLSSAGQWESHLPLLLYAYRTARHQATGFSPFELMFGRSPQCLDNFAERARGAGATPAVHHQTLSDTLAEFRELVDAQLAQSAEEAQRTRPPPPEYRTGDPVWLWDSCPRHKLAPRWLGGWKVETVLGPVTFRIVNEAGHRKVVHLDKLKVRVPRTGELSNADTPGVLAEPEHPTPTGPAANETSTPGAHSGQQPAATPSDGPPNELALPPRASHRVRHPPARLQDYFMYS